MKRDPLASAIRLALFAPADFDTAGIFINWEIAGRLPQREV